MTCLINGEAIAEHQTAYGDLSRNVNWAMPHQVMPIAPGRKHLVTSELDPKGNYRLWIDDLLVATATLDEALPLGPIIPPNVRPPGCSAWGELEFKGQGLPQVLFADQAGIIIGPCARGYNVARRIRFAPIDGPGGLPARNTGQ